MPPNERYHIHISVNQQDDLIVEKVWTDGEKPNELLASVDLTEKDAPDYDPVFGDHAEVVVETTEARIQPTTDGTVIVVFGI